MRIGIPGYESDGFFGVSSDYMDFIALAGTPVILHPAEKLPKDIDGVLLPGGADVSPSRYGIPSYFSGKSNPFLEYFDQLILPDILGKIPVFGICRGLQTINVALGGTLIQHLHNHPYSDYDRDTVHGVSRGGNMKKMLEVNSFHHQAIRELGDGLKVELVSTPGNPIPEAISGHLIYAVQWHPERLRDGHSISSFVSLMNKGVIDEKV